MVRVWMIKTYVLNTNPPPPPILALGFHLFYEGEAPHPNGTAWAVTILPVSHSKRFTDSSLAARFWEAIDNEIYVKKRYLLPASVKETA